MNSSNPLKKTGSEDIDTLKAKINGLLAELPERQHHELIYQALSAIVELSKTKTDRLDWKLAVGSLQDMQRAIEVFYPHRHTRKVSIFGSARTATTAPEYIQAVKFGQRITERGFMVLTGAGGGIMAAGNTGAGSEHSFGLNISLPFEQSANLHVNQERLVSFKYFFTRKLFFMRESDAIAFFPGGFGTQDELFEGLTLCQTGKTTPRAFVLIDRPGGDYWHEWDQYVRNHMLEQKLISEDDRSLYFITDDVEAACDNISNFYSVYHSSRWVKDLFVIRLNCPISDDHLDFLNQEFSDALVKGKIDRSAPLPVEKNEPTIWELPRLVMHFDQFKYGRLYELIRAINDTTCDREIKQPELHPEHK